MYDNNYKFMYENYITIFTHFYKHKKALNI